MPEKTTNFIKIENPVTPPVENKAERIMSDFDYLQQLQSRLGKYKENQPDSPLLLEVDDMLKKFDHFKRNIAFENDPNQRTIMQRQLNLLDYLSRADKILNDLEKDVNLQNQDDTTTDSIGEYKELTTKDETVLAEATGGSWKNIVPETKPQDETVTGEDGADTGETPVNQSLEQMQKQVERLLDHTTRIREEHGLNVTEAKKVANLPGFASARKNLLNLQKEIQQAQENNTALTKEDLSKIRQRIAKHIVAMRSKETTDETPSPETPPSPAVFGIQIPVAGVEGKFGAQALHEGLLTLKQVNRLPENPEVQKSVERMLKITGYVGAEGLTEDEANELSELANKINQPESLIKIPAQENLYKELNEKLAASREKLPLSTQERVKRMAKILSLSLLAASPLTQSTKQEVEGFSNNTDLGVSGQFESDTQVSTDPIVAPTPLEIPTVQEAEPNIDDIPTTPSQEQGMEEGGDIVEQLPVVSQTPAFSPVPPLSRPSEVENPIVYDASVPPIDELPTVTLEADSEVALGVGMEAETSDALKPEVQVEVPPVLETHPPLITVPEDCTVSQAVERAYRNGQFDAYLTRPFSSTREFTMEYLGFDRLINEHPELVKHLLEIDSGNTDIIPAGATFNPRVIIEVLNGEQTVAGLLEQYSQYRDSELTKAQSVSLNANIDTLKTVAQDTPEATTRSLEQVLSRVDTLVTPAAVEVYKNEYKGGEEAWKRDFETYIKTYLPKKNEEGWLSNWFNSGTEAAGDIYEHIAKSNMTIGEFNSLRNGDARALRDYLRPLQISIADFRALQTMLDEIKQMGTVLISDDMSVLQVQEAAFVDRHSRLIANQS